MSGIGRSALSSPSLQVVAVQAVQEEIEALRRDINILKKVVAEKEQEMLGTDQSSSNKLHSNNNGNSYTKRVADEALYSL